MRACRLLLGAHSFSCSLSNLRITQGNYLLGGRYRIKRASLNADLLRVLSRNFHLSPQLLGIKSVWRNTIWGAPRPKIERQNSSHDEYLRSYNQELVQVEHHAPELHRILSEGHPERILYGLLDPIGETFFHHASSSFFAATFALLDPKYFVEPFKEIYRHMKPSLIHGPNELRIVRALEDQFGALTLQLEEIVKRRRDAGHTLDLAACKHLLAFAAALADKQIAELVWEQMMPLTGTEPDLDCFAYYMEAFCWAGSWRKDEEFNFRVAAFNIAAREEGGVKGFESYRVGPIEGLRARMTKMFGNLATSGLEANEAIFANLMVAMGREGDLEGVKSILKSVWNIDVDLLVKVDEEEVETPSHYETDSSLRPTNQLLFAIAHVFSINNEVLLGLRLVDFVSRQYDLSIPYLVWFQILEFVYVLSRWPYRSRRERGFGVGWLPESTFEDVWLMCTDEPHNIRLTIPLKALRSRTLHNRFEFAQALSVFENCKEHLLDIREDVAASIDDLLVQSEETRQQYAELNQSMGSDRRWEREVYANPNPSTSFNDAESPGPTDHYRESSQEIEILREKNSGLSNGAMEFAPSNGDDDADISEKSKPPPFTAAILPAQWLDARRKFVLSSLAFERDLQSLIVLFRHIVKVARSRTPRPTRAAFERRFLPQIIENLADFLPDEILYSPMRPEGQAGPIVTLYTKTARMRALQKYWSSERWGEALRKELFTATNARLRSFCHVDSHEQLLHVCQMLRPDWLTKTTHTYQKQMLQRERTLTDYVQPPEGTFLDSQNLEPSERMAEAKSGLDQQIEEAAIQRDSIKNH